jgi:hypothetical protein
VFKKLAEEERQAAAAQSDQQDKDTASNLPAFGEHTFCTPKLACGEVPGQTKTELFEAVKGKKGTHQKMHAFCIELLADA